MDDFPRILIVDDEPDMADSIAAVLLASGYGNINILNDSPAAVAHINSSNYDLVLLDVMMPGLTGFQLLDALDRKDMNTIFIIMTGDTSVDTAIEALRRGASDYIRKPCDPDELVIRIDKALSQQNLKNENHKIATENHNLEQQLRQSQKMEAIGVLAGGVAHDFNNILAIILGNTELARKTVSADHLLHQNLDNIQLASTRAKELINQLLSYSRKGDLEWKPLELNSLMTECLALVRASIPSNVIIRSDLADSSYFIDGDATQIHQIIINLCTNASHAMDPDGGRLDVRLEKLSSAPADMPAGNYIKLSVTDTGTGISSEDIDRIFDPYFTTKEAGRGTGMGLAVVNGIVQNHGGDIKVVSEPDVGTEFQVFLPLSNGSATTVKKHQENPTPEGCERILLVDDEDMIIDVMERILSQWGYQVTSFTDSRAALAAFEDKPDDFDLVLADMTMPSLTGDILAEKIYQIRRLVPIILCSGLGENLDRVKLHGVGVREFISKPTNLKDLAQTLRRTLDNSKAERRQDIRFAARSGAFVIFESSPEEPGTLLDVSIAGLAVSYGGSTDGPDFIDQLSIVTTDGLTVDKIHCESVSDVETDASKTTRRRGIRFNNLTPIQVQQLNQFIANQTNSVTAAKVALTTGRFSEAGKEKP